MGEDAEETRNAGPFITVEKRDFKKHNFCPSFAKTLYSTWLLRGQAPHPLDISSTTWQPFEEEVITKMCLPCVFETPDSNKVILLALIFITV